EGRGAKAHVHDLDVGPAVRDPVERRDRRNRARELRLLVENPDRHDLRVWRDALAALRAVGRDDPGNSGSVAVLVLRAVGAAWAGARAVGIGCEALLAPDVV